MLMFEVQANLVRFQVVDRLLLYLCCYYLALILGCQDLPRCV